MFSQIVRSSVLRSVRSYSTAGAAAPLKKPDPNQNIYIGVGALALAGGAWYYYSQEPEVKKEITAAKEKVVGH